MPAKPKYRRARSTRKRPTTKLKKIEKKVNTLYKSIESNYKDTNVNTNVSYDIDSTTHLSALTTGGTPGSEGDRLGRWVKPTYLEFRGAVTRAPDAAAQVVTQVRVMVIQAKQRFTPNTASSGGTTNVLTSQGTNITPYQPFDINNRRHFTVLLDRTYVSGVMNTNATYADHIDSIHIPVRFRLKLSRRIQYQDDGTTTEGGQIYMIAYSSIASTSVEPVLIGVSRLHYVDM